MSNEPKPWFQRGEEREDMIAEIERLHAIAAERMDLFKQAASKLERAKDYVLKSIELFNADPPDNDFQRGYLVALKVIRDEAFS
jgi:hypothetical protein